MVSGKTKFSFESGGASIGGLERARMSSVGGFEKEKQQLKSVLIDPLKEDEDTTQELDLSNIRNTAVTDFNFKGILIVGPSGIGKVGITLVLSVHYSFCSCSHLCAIDFHRKGSNQRVEGKVDPCG